MYFDKFALSRRGFLGHSLLGVTAATGAGLALPGLARADTTLERAKSAGFVRVGFANEAPFGFADESGKLTGEAPVVLTYILKKMGIAEVDGVLTEFGSLIPGLKAGRFDIIAAGMYVKPDRCAQILFSEPTYSISEAFAVKAGNPLKLADLRGDRRQSRGQARGHDRRDPEGLCDEVGGQAGPGQQLPRYPERHRRPACRARRCGGARPASPSAT